MLIIQVLAAALAAAAPVKVALPGFSALHMDPQESAYYTERFGDALAQAGFDVTTPEKIAAQLGFERTKEMAGCSDAASECMAELGNALGVDALVIGTMAKTGTQFHIDAKAIRPSDGQTLAVVSAEAAREEDLREALNVAANALIRDVSAKLGRGVVEVRPLRRYAWIPAAVGGAAVVGAGVMFGLSAGNYATLTSNPAPKLSQNDAIQLAKAGDSQQTGGFIATGVAAIALGTAAYMYFGGPSKVEASAALVPGGGGVAVRGVWP